MAPESQVTQRYPVLAQRVLRDVGAPLVLTRLLLILVTLSAPVWRGAVPDPAGFLSRAPQTGGALVSRWYRWDAEWYIRIAGNGPEMGYSTFQAERGAHNFVPFAFFPLYPLTIRAVAALIPGALDAVPAGSPARPQLVIVALVVSNVLFLLALIALYVLAEARAGPATARRVVWLLCLFPTTIFFSAPYTESMFVLWLALFFLALARRHWWRAGLCGALAAATRSNGVLLVVPYLVCYWQHRRDLAGATAVSQKEATTGSPSSQRAGLARRFTALLPVAVIPLGLLAYLAYQWLAWGDPLLFQKAQKAWSRQFELPWVGIVDGFVWSLRHWPHLLQPNWRGLTDALYAVVFLALTALAWRTIDWPGRAYAVLFWFYVLSTPEIVSRYSDVYSDTLISMARFLLVLIPVWLWLAESRWRTWLVAAPSALLLLFYAARWVNGGWIG